MALVRLAAHRETARPNTNNERPMRRLRNFLLAMALAATLPTRAGDFTDLWWNPAQSGWGMNLVHQGETAFVTLFVYGPDRQPTWYSASDAQVYAYSGSGGLPHFAGSLHRTTGPWHAGPFDPSTVTLVRVGSISIEPLAKDRVRVTYDVDGRTSSAELVRASIALPIAPAFYHASWALRESFPGGPPYGTARYSGDISLLIDDGRATLRFDESTGRRCEYTGPYSQAGKLSAVSGTFSCTASGIYPARAGTFTIEDLEFTAQGITGLLRTAAQDRHESGRFAAARF